MKNFNFYLPTKIIFGCGRINDLKELTAGSTDRIMIVSERNLAENTNIVNMVLGILKGKQVSVFLDVEENPAFETIEKGKIIARENNIQLIIGLGGGSPMDAAKGIALAAANTGNLRTLINMADLPNNPIPIICIPTTSGTGSEVTPYAVFTDRITGNKCGYANPKIFPIVSIVDPELTYSMPEQVTINTGLDVLAHSIESYLSTDGFPMNDIIALEAVKIVLTNLKNATHNDKDAMNAMSYASMLGGIAITHGGTILPHIMGYPLTVFHNIPHGRACIIMLPAVLAFLRANSFIKDKIEKLDKLFEELNGIEGFLHTLGVSFKLSSYGVEETEIDEYVKKVIVKGDIKITPAVVTEKDIKDIYVSSL